MTSLRTNPDVLMFFATAKHYCELVELAPDGRDECLKDLAITLAKLVQYAFILTNVWGEKGAEVPPQFEPTHEEWKAICGKVTQLFDGGFYREFFDPRSLELKEEPCIASLADDLADIWRELVPGIRAWETGDDRFIGDILWHWVHFGFRSHWGYHATGALRYLYWSIYHGLG